MPTWDDAREQIRRSKKQAVLERDTREGVAALPTCTLYAQRSQEHGGGNYLPNEKEKERGRKGEGE